MPNAPKRPCPTPGCPELTSRGPCPQCARTRDRFRGTRTARGYSNDWLRLRAWFISQPENVLCARCTKEGRTTQAQEVDHIVPFNGTHDPKRLDPQNLQSLCIPCHRSKHFSPPGYDNAWLRLREEFINHPDHVLCCMCQAQGVTRRAQEVDHVIPFNGKNDPLRLDPKNLQSLCVDHHRKKHA